jgi:hypothetical protein
MIIPEHSRFGVVLDLRVGIEDTGKRANTFRNPPVELVKTAIDGNRTGSPDTTVMFERCGTCIGKKRKEDEKTVWKTG